MGLFDQEGVFLAAALTLVGCRGVRLLRGRRYVGVAGHAPPNLGRISGFRSVDQRQPDLANNPRPGSSHPLRWRVLSELTGSVRVKTSSNWRTQCEFRQPADTMADIIDKGPFPAGFPSLGIALRPEAIHCHGGAARDKCFLVIGTLMIEILLIGGLALVAALGIISAPLSLS